MKISTAFILICLAMVVLLEITQAAPPHGRGKGKGGRGKGKGKGRPTEIDHTGKGSSSKEDSSIEFGSGDSGDSLSSEGTSEDEEDDCDKPTAEPEGEGTAEPESEGTSEPESEGTSEPEGEGTSEPESEGTAEPESEGTAEPEGEGTAEPEGFSCPPDAESGFLYPDPMSCTHFYQCVHMGSQYQRAARLACPDGLYFNPEMDYCDWPDNVPDCGNGWTLP